MGHRLDSIETCLYTKYKNYRSKFSKSFIDKVFDKQFVFGGNMPLLLLFLSLILPSAYAHFNYSLKLSPGGAYDMQANIRYQGVELNQAFLKTFFNSNYLKTATSGTSVFKYKGVHPETLLSQKRSGRFEMETHVKKYGVIAKIKNNCHFDYGPTLTTTCSLIETRASLVRLNNKITTSFTCKKSDNDVLCEFRSRGVVHGLNLLIFRKTADEMALEGAIEVLHSTYIVSYAVNSGYFKDLKTAPSSYYFRTKLSGLSQRVSRSMRRGHLERRLTLKD
jgi:hypothetical protein